MVDSRGTTREIEEHVIRVRDAGGVLREVSIDHDPTADELAAMVAGLPPVKVEAAAVPAEYAAWAAWRDIAAEAARLGDDAAVAVAAAMAEAAWSRLTHALPRHGQPPKGKGAA